MSCKKPLLSTLANGELDRVDNKDICIASVKIYKEDLILNIYLESKKNIKIEDIDKIEKFFKDKFENFNLELNIKYPIEGDKLEKLNFYKKNIIDYIKANINSSVSWIDQLKIEIDEEEINIYPPNKAALHLIDSNNILKNLETRILNELGIPISIVMSDDKIKVREDFLEQKNLEEDTMAKEIISRAKEIRQNPPSLENKNYIYGKKINADIKKIEDISLESGSCAIEGKIFQLETREIRNNKTLVTFNISDKTNSITAKCFLSEDKSADFLTNIKDGSYVSLQGDVTFDTYSRSTVIMIKSLNLLKESIKEDLEEEKRVELHLHTQMSSMDGICELESIIKRAKDWGHEAIAITDHGVVQAFPNAMDLGKKLDMKIIYGLEGYLVNDKKNIVKNYNSSRDYNTYIVFDIETTGLSAINDKITEIGAIKIKDGQVIDNYSQLVNPERNIPEFITKLTGIDDEMVKDKPTIDEVIGEFNEFISDDVLVAHNANFDVGFIRENMEKNNIKLNNPVLDTLELSRSVFPDLKSHKLNLIAKHLGVKLENHHRAIDDATATADILLKLLELLSDKGVYTFDQINSLNSNKDVSKDRPFHVILLAKNLVGLKNLYKLVSESHMNYFYRQPRIPKSLIEENREGLIVGSACEAGELFKAIIGNASDDEVKEIVKFYDFLEIQAIENNRFLIDKGILKDTEQLKNINKKIYKIGLENNKPVVATGDVHFLDPEDEIYRRILMSGQKFSDADSQPPLYFKTTREMLDEFSYLGDDVAREVVIENTNLINNMVEEMIPIPEGTFPPVIEGAEEELKEITYKKAIEIYDSPLPEIVENRLNKELTSIIENGYAVMYIIAQKLVWRSLEDGYLVGSRGSVGSSFAATMSGITEINPLVPHYICPKCKYSEFFTDGSIDSGADLEDKACPKCNSELTKDGHDIPFEVFLGFEGDKEPDIDLNFASEYQAQAHKYTEDLFGEGYVFRAGTIGTIADKTAYGFVKKYFEQKDMSINSAELNRLINGCTGIKRTSGQHPGGVMIVPKDKDILDFTPIQYPANDKKSGVVTTHFDYNSISGRILKLDILGHDVPTIIKMLEDMTGVISTDIPLDEEKTMKLFSSTESLGISKEDINCEVGTLGIPEFGTKFVRQMLVDTKPSTFSELVRISGLSHGTDVWINNAQNLVRENIAPLRKVISTREDIMLTLINAGGDKKQAFTIMEKVRKGRGLSVEEEAMMRKLNIPDWYIDSCKKIKYMFPKAHAAAYVMMSFRIAYFKVYHPQAFYATYFTTKASDFDADLAIKGQDHVRRRIKELESMPNDITSKEKNQLTVLEVVLEMYCRGFSFKNIDLYLSDSDNFIVTEDGILPPLKSLDGLGENVARRIVKEREISRFISVEDLVRRAGVNKSVLEVLRDHGCLNGIPVSNQVSLFNI